MDWKSRWSEQHADVDALKQQLETEGFNPYEWSGRPPAVLISIIFTPKMKSFVSYLAQQM